MELTARQRINAAWDEEGSIGRLGMKPAANKEIQDALIPRGGDWTCIAREGDITRRVMWRSTEVALINPRGDLADQTEGQIAMAIRAMPMLDKALRAIWILAKDPANSELIGQMARAAIDYVEQPAPRIADSDDEEHDDDDDC